ncbi:hypothetical protein NEF87_004490 [Candidatus Lokiarchaeum ossiferum]|uniref:Reverse transcriptase domain-containing protein n=1 Tax=Candidatus Lokiarchaeum ossiferum TaxID=2951803 RepID=A0ABY6HXE7_9ARCH|nr:hypothetical protein NEF87_004490 [Candidatus Lokiarchaeum sp. B-35]
MKKINESNKERHEVQVCWSKIDWISVCSYVERLQDRIYIATEKKEFRTVKNLQKLAIRSHYVKLYAIRNVTQLNSGRKTPGIDGITCLNNKERESLYEIVKTFSYSSIKSYHPKPVKRIEIPKANGKLRPIGIPTVFDRVIQMLVKIALEPEFEQKFHQNSFGFRPGRCCQDAVEVINYTIRYGKGEYILNADITGCFDNIAHSTLLSELHVFKPLVKKWLKAGVLINNRKYGTEKGTPQGGIISPLLTNIALNRLDYLFNRKISYRGKEYQTTLVRYADDIVILSTSKNFLVRIKDVLAKTLLRQGLTLNTNKTVLIHKSEGFKFLGFHFIQHPYKTLWIQPEKASVQRMLHKLKVLLDSHKQIKSDALIYALNKRILGWARYYQYCRINGIFNRMDSIVFRWIWKWCTRRHPRKPRKWLRQRYFKAVNSLNWVFSGDIWSLSYFVDVKRKKYRWRVGKESYLNPRERKLWKQNNICNSIYNNANSVFS